MQFGPRVDAFLALERVNSPVKLRDGSFRSSGSLDRQDAGSPSSFQRGLPNKRACAISRGAGDSRDEKHSTEVANGERNRTPLRFNLKKWTDGY